MSGRDRGRPTEIKGQAVPKTFYLDDACAAEVAARAKAHAYSESAAARDLIMAGNQSHYLAELDRARKENVELGAALDKLRRINDELNSELTAAKAIHARQHARLNPLQPPAQYPQPAKTTQTDKMQLMIDWVKRYRGDVSADIELNTDGLRGVAEKHLTVKKVLEHLGSEEAFMALLRDPGDSSVR